LSFVAGYLLFAVALWLSRSRGRASTDHGAAPSAQHA
jgi:hypothetical protein